MNSATSSFTPKELRKLRSLKNPWGIQKFLDDIPYHLEDTAWSPRRVLADKSAHCLEGAIFAAATHFNPVDLACGVRNWRGAPFDLRRFVDRDAVFIADKSSEGRSLKALEHPGLWNGAMAGWKTIFLEVPVETFNPVKTVNDLLRPSHQP